MDQNPLGDDYSDDPGRPLDELCDIIVARYHAYLHRTLPLIRAELAGLTEPDSAPAGSLAETRAAFNELAHLVQGHLAKEEHVLFPALEALARADREGGSRPALPFPTVLYPIRLLESEHARIETALERLRQATQALVAPESLAPLLVGTVASWPPPARAPPRGKRGAVSTRPRAGAPAAVVGYDSAVSMRPDDELLRRIPLFRRLSAGLRARVAEVARQVVRTRRHDLLRR